MQSLKATCALIAALAVANPGDAATCSAQFDIISGADHGSLPTGTVLKGQINYDEGRAMQMGPETRSYLASGIMRVTAPDGTSITGSLRVIHLVRTPYFADYVSFDIKDVGGDLGGVTDYEDPMLVTFFAPRGSLESFDLPRSTKDWQALSKRREFQVHTPDTMQTLPGKVEGFRARCQ